MITPHYFTIAERREQLMALVVALDNLIPIISELPDFVSELSDYEFARSRAFQLAKGNFYQSDLSLLAKSVPNPFPYHPGIATPQVKGPDGSWSVPDWFTRFECKLQPVVEAAQRLREVGYY